MTERDSKHAVLAGLRSPFDEAFLDLQPLLFADGFVYARSDEHHADDAEFVDFWGKPVNLRRFVPIRTLGDHVRRLNRAAVHLVLDPSWPVAGRVSPDARDPLWYFLTIIVPGIERASFGQAVVTAREKDQLAELVVETDRLVDGLPVPVIPSPALCLGGGLLTLEEVAPVSRDRTHVRLGGRFMVPDWGPPLTLEALRCRWHSVVDSHLSRLASRLRAELGSRADLDAYERAQAELRHSGYIERGDLVFIGRRRSAILGHALLAHYNKTLHRQCDHGDLCIAAPLTVPAQTPSVSNLRVYARKPSGGWKQEQVGGICTGSPRYSDARCPGARLVLFLRWAADNFTHKRNRAFSSATA